MRRWCGREDSNFHGLLTHSDLNAARLPIPPQPLQNVRGWHLMPAPWHGTRHASVCIPFHRDLIKSCFAPPRQNNLPANIICQLGQIDTATAPRPSQSRHSAVSCRSSAGRHRRRAQHNHPLCGLFLLCAKRLIPDE